MNLFENCDHTFYELIRLGKNPEDPVIGGDDNSWGDGGKLICEINIFYPSLGGDDIDQKMFIGSSSYKLSDDWDYESVVSFINSNSSEKFSDEEMDFILWHISDTMLGEDAGIQSYERAGEFPHSELEDDTKILDGCLAIHKNIRYESSTSISEDGIVEWKDEVNPDDDAQIIAILV